MKGAAFDLTEFFAESFENLVRLFEGDVLFPQVGGIVVEFFVLFLLDLIADGRDDVLDFGGNSIAFGTRRTA